MHVPLRVQVPIAVAAGAALAGQAQYELYVWACKEKQTVRPGRVGKICEAVAVDSYTSTP